MKKCGTVPLTCYMLKYNKNVHNESAREGAASIFKYAVSKPISFSKISLQALQEMNKQAMTKMIVNGFNGGILEKSVRKQLYHSSIWLDKFNSTAKQRVMRMSEEGISLSSIFYTTGFAAISTDEIF